MNLNLLCSHRSRWWIPFDRNSFPHKFKPYYMLLSICLYLCFENSVITHGIIHQIVFGYFDLYVFYYLEKYYKWHKIFKEKLNNLIDETIFPLKFAD